MKKSNLLNRDSWADSVALCTTQQLPTQGTTCRSRRIFSASTLSVCLGSAPAFTCRYGTPVWSSTSPITFILRSAGPLLHIPERWNPEHWPATSRLSPTPERGSPSISPMDQQRNPVAVTWQTAPRANKGTLRAFDATNLQTQF